MVELIRFPNGLHLGCEKKKKKKFKVSDLSKRKSRVAMKENAEASGGTGISLKSLNHPAFCF